MEKGELGTMLSVLCIKVRSLQQVLLSQGRIADFVVNEPMVIGHESAG